MKLIKVTLTNGVTAFPLDGDGLGLEEWPAFIDGLGIYSSWDEESARWRGEQPMGVENVEMALIAKGRDVTRRVARLLEALTRDEGNCYVTVQSARGGYRRFPLRFIETGGISWFPAPYSATQANVPLRFEAARNLWAGRTIRYEARPGDTVQKVPYGGDVASWPTITIPPGAPAVKLRLREEDEWQTIPTSATGWTVYTAPGERGVIDGGGNPLQGLVPFWPEPPLLEGGALKVHLTAAAGKLPSGVVIKADELWRKGWA